METSERMDNLLEQAFDKITLENILEPLKPSAAIKGAKSFEYIMVPVKYQYRITVKGLKRVMERLAFNPGNMYIANTAYPLSDEPCYNDIDGDRPDDVPYIIHGIGFSYAAHTEKPDVIFDTVLERIYIFHDAHLEDYMRTHPCLDISIKVIIIDFERAFREKITWVDILKEGSGRENS